MVHRDSVRSKLRELNFTYKGRLKRTELWRQRGTTKFVFLPLRDLIDDEWVRSQFAQLGCSADEIESFLIAAKS